jgi:tRNA(Ile)-lysidine synthetase-like protein
MDQTPLPVKDTAPAELFPPAQASLDSAAQSPPAGAWAVGVSGGADSVALLLLLSRRADLSLRVVHLDHQLRGADSEADATFVASLAAKLSLPVTLARRRDVEAAMGDLPANASARYRAARMALFRQSVAAHRLSGVILAHHADDQAETVLQRLLRSAGPAGLAGMSGRSCVDGLVILRPLLNVGRDDLRAYLRSRGQTWREDASNASPKYLRNRLRAFLAKRAELREPLIELAEQCRQLKLWARKSAPDLPAQFPVATLWPAPKIIARESARRWLLSAGVPAGEISAPVLDRLLNMCLDAASPAKQTFPGGVVARRKSGMIFADG